MDVGRREKDQKVSNEFSNHEEVERCKMISSLQGYLDNCSMAHNLEMDTNFRRLLVAYFNKWKKHGAFFLHVNFKRTWNSRC